MAQHPAAGRRGKLVDEGHIQIDRRGQSGENAALSGVCGGLDLDGVVTGGGEHIIAHGCQGFPDLRDGESAQVLVAVQLEPQQQRLLGKYVLLQGTQLGKGIPKIGIVGVKGPPLLLRPAFSRLFAHGLQQLGIVTGSAELNGIEPAGLKEIQEFVVGLNARRAVHGRHDPVHRGGDTRLLPSWT